MIRSRLYRGRVQHHRLAPREHRFAYGVAFLGLDLDEAPTLLARHSWFGFRRPAPMRFHRGDYFGDPQRSLADTVRAEVQRLAGMALDGPIELVTTLRTAGYAFNPVSFYLCRDHGGDLRCILAEITNTPWRERCVYVLPESQRVDGGASWRFAFDKRFHISPFMPMHQRYEWSFRCEGGRLGIHMRNLQGGDLRFTATMGLRAEAWSHAALTRHALAMPLAPIQIVARIYRQALALWLKRIPVFDHPDTAGAPDTTPAPWPTIEGAS